MHFKGADSHPINFDKDKLSCYIIGVKEKQFKNLLYLKSYYWMYGFFLTNKNPFSENKCTFNKKVVNNSFVWEKFRNTLQVILSSCLYRIYISILFSIYIDATQICFYFFLIIMIAYFLLVASKIYNKVEVIIVFGCNFFLFC